MTRAGPSQRLDLDGAPIAPRVTLPQRKYMTQVPGARSKFALRVVCWARLMALLACSCRYLFIGDIRKVSVLEGIGETVLLIVCSISPLDWGISSSLETIVVRRTRQRNTGSRCQLRMVVSQISGQTFDDSEQMLQVCCGPMKFTRSRHETNTPDTCPFSQFVAGKTSTRVRNQKLELRVYCCIHSFARCEMRVAPFGSKRCRGFPSGKHKHDDSLQGASKNSAKKPLL